MSSDLSAEEITKASKSNLAIAFIALPKEKRRDLITYYAFCRSIDDLADDYHIPLATREAGLQAWCDGLINGFKDPGELEARVVEMRDRHQIPNEYFLDLIDGCRRDLAPQRFGSWEELQEYTYRVAGTVGLVCVRLFQCADPNADEYARHLGDALQLTNIIRDVGEDLDNGLRIYLPLGDFARFQYSERDLVGKVYDGRFQAMMAYQTERAEHYYQLATDALEQRSRKSLVATEIMRDIYFQTLQKIKKADYDVFSQRFSLSKPRKLATIAKHMMLEKFGR